MSTSVPDSEAVGPASSVATQPQVAGSGITTSPNGGNESGEQRARKRMKNSRACDHCRSKKLRCEWIEESEPALCTECERRQIPCLTVKPAQLDPRKRARLASAAPAPLPAASAERAVCRQDSSTNEGEASSCGQALSTEPPSSSRPSAFSPSASPRVAAAGLNLLARCVDLSAPPQTVFSPALTSPPDQRVLGMTCLSQLLLEIQPTQGLNDMDREFGHRRQCDGDIRTEIVSSPSMVNNGGERLTSETMMQLVEHYISHVLPLFPVVTPSDFAALNTLSPVTLMAACTVAALSRNHPFQFFSTVRALFTTTVSNSNVFEVSSLANIEAILIMSMSAELHGKTNSSSGSLAFLRAGTAIRMAHDLGLHRRPAADLSPQAKQRRLRVWMCCTIADRWYACSYGQPRLIDLEDAWDYLEERPHADPYLLELFSLSELLGRATRAVDRPRLLKSTTDAILNAIVHDADLWLAQLPEDLQFCGRASTPQGGLLHLLFVCLESVFFRPFMKQDGSLPVRLTFRPSAARFFTIVTRSQTAIDWTLAEGTAILDHWLVGMYSLLYATYVQFYSHTKSAEMRTFQSIEAVKNGMQLWVQGNSDGSLSLRQKVFKITLLLHQAAAQQHRASLPTVQETVEARTRSSCRASSTSCREGTYGNGATAASDNAPRSTSSCDQSLSYAGHRVDPARLAESRLPASMGTTSAASPPIPSPQIASPAPLPPSSRTLANFKSLFPSAHHDLAPNRALPLAAFPTIDFDNNAGGVLPEWLQSNLQTWSEQLLGQEWDPHQLMTDMGDNGGVGDGDGEQAGWFR